MNKEHESKSPFENPRTPMGCLWIVVITLISIVGTFALADVILNKIGM